MAFISKSKESKDAAPNRDSAYCYGTEEVYEEQLTEEESYEHVSAGAQPFVNKHTRTKTLDSFGQVSLTVIGQG